MQTNGRKVIYGKIGKYWGERGFGFIDRDDGQENVFFHVKQYQSGEPEIGARVSFDISTSERNGRACAVDVRRVGGSETPPI
ncbi:unnamed protein product, partial [Phaeothamnion confervicola]